MPPLGQGRPSALEFICPHDLLLARGNASSQRRDPMATLFIEKPEADRGVEAAPPGTAPDKPYPMPPLALVRCAVEMVCVGLICALFLLRGLDAIIHG